MNLDLIASVVRRLVSDSAFRAAAVADPGSALAEYKLEASERAAVTKLCAQMAEGQQVIVRPAGWWW